MSGGRVSERVGREWESERDRGRVSGRVSER